MTSNFSGGVRVRFAPSPTGYLHVGGARTALFDFLFARKYKGVFLLRIEDTDVERSTEEMTQGILDAMTWMGLTWDEGPFFQSRRLDLYRAAARRLLDAGAAYCCTCAAGAHDGACRERDSRQAAGAAIRFKVPEGPVTWVDEVMGEITIGSDTIEDFVLLRSDTQPTYHLSVVVDDSDMKITHVVRGADHISNTPKQILLYRALDIPLPFFAHVPLILGPDKTRMSKRHGATSVMSYREQGIIPEAFRNFLVLLGWSPGSDQELFTEEELVSSFSLQGISRTNAVFNPEKLLWFNAQYLARIPHEQLVRYLKPEYERAGLWRDSFEAFESSEGLWFRHLLDLLRPRSKTLLDFAPQSKIYLVDPLEFEPAALEKFRKDPAAIALLPALADRLEALPEFTLETTETAVRSLAAEKGVKAGALIGAARVALTGQLAAPGIFDVVVLTGQQRTVARLRQAALL